MKREINLLPVDLQKKPVMRVGRFRVSVLAVLIFLFVLLGSVAFYYYLTSLQRQISVIKTEMQSLQPVVAKIEKMRAEVTLKEQQITSLQLILREQINWGDILNEIGDGMPEDLWLTDLKADEAGLFTLRGNASSLMSVGLLQRRLSQMPYFEEVSLRHSERIAADDNTTIKFEMNGRLRQGGGNQGVEKTVP
ncbi:MAG: PilN domain-containing protein [Syntrophomonadaceae bacterium]|nr:PilN domain-containing protein [Syntrophomonadaceae bacterium]